MLRSLPRALPAAAALAAVTLGPARARARTPRPAPGETGSAALGVIVGDPTGGTAKVFLRPRHALQSHVGFGPFHLGAGRVDLSYLFHSRPWGAAEGLKTRGYVGVGVGVAFWSRKIGQLGPFGPDPEDFRNVSFFFRAPVLGVAMHMRTVPIDIFIEAAYSPMVGPPITYWNFDFGLGARYWF